MGRHPARPAARTLRAVRETDERLGEVLAAMVCLRNPELIVIGGTFAILQDDLLAGIRSVVHECAFAEAACRIRVETTSRNADLGLLRPATLLSNGRCLRRGSDPGRRWKVIASLSVT
ncbi:hypothetical protein [Streptomyces sp. NPDC050121]|uniref:hypothetical protein n=1 Tax=Streptomyces sp. NPDC050121 TaxID=3365601 RepID=UPI0037A56B4D